MKKINTYIIEKLHLNKNIKSYVSNDGYLYAVFSDGDGGVHYFPSDQFKDEDEFKDYILNRAYKNNNVSDIEIFDDPKAAQDYELKISSKR